MSVYSRITGTGSYLPEKVMTNSDIAKIVDTDDQWIQERTGIKQRHIAAEGQFSSDLGVEAAKEAIKSAGKSASDIDLIICATTTPEHIFPSTACVIQEKLGIAGCGAFDVQAVCSGFVYALSIADQYIKTGSAKNVLVIGTETLSRIIDWTDRRTCILFADGAGAVVLSADSQPGILSTHLHADGANKSLLYVPWGPGRGPTDEHKMFIHMEGSDVFKVAVSTLGKTVVETLAANNMQSDDIDWLVPHQANIRIIAATARKLKMSMDKVVVTVDQHGNTSAASIPLAFDTAVKSGQIKQGDTCLLEAFGGGFTWGSALLKL